MKKQCGNCKYLQPDSDTRFGTKHDNSEVYVGICRRYPPSVFREDKHQSDFPWVFIAQWCGEYQPAKQ